jgi:osmotically-inducible protein OsmY
MHVLERRDNVDAEDIEVIVENGVVTLRGSVPTWMSKDSAFEATQQVSGVIDIIDELSIGEMM